MGLCVCVSRGCLCVCKPASLYVCDPGFKKICEAVTVSGHEGRVGGGV